jgi:hypothetical protein
LQNNSGAKIRNIFEMLYVFLFCHELKIKNVLLQKKSKMKRIFSLLFLFITLFLLACNNNFEIKVKQSIQTQLEVYPKSTLQDIYKNLFQDRFGPEHIISDTVSARLYLEKELATFETSNSVEIEYLGINHDFVRVNLMLVKQGKISQEKLLSAFINSAKKISKNDVKAWQSEWKQIVEIIKRMDLNISDFEDDAQKIDSLLNEGKYAMHHSAIFREFYQPHYRIVERKIFERKLEQYL